jgi:hypothetical protein
MAPPTNAMSYIKLEAMLWTAVGQAQMQGDLGVASELIGLLEKLDDTPGH